MKNTVYIALGANLGDPVEQANQAIERVKNLHDTRLIQCSSFYRSKPLGPSDQPDYLNTVFMIETELEPLTLLDELQKIEQELGRVRKAERWGPRTLDLDILLFGNQKIDSNRLTVPHYDMRNREFVLYPLLEISPDLVLPSGETVRNLVKIVGKNGLIPWFK